MNISAFDIEERYELLTLTNTIYSYIGSFQEKEFNQLLNDLETFIATQVENKVIRKKLFHILIEITQNLHNYSKESEKERKMFFVISQQKAGYKIVTGNYLLNKEIPGIRTRIEMVNSMSEQEVKELYRGILNFGGVSNGGGAGLGFIDLARRSGEKLIYKFEEIDDKFSFFTLEVNLNN